MAWCSFTHIQLLFGAKLIAKEILLEEEWRVLNTELLMTVCIGYMLIYFVRNAEMAKQRLIRCNL